MQTVPQILPQVIGVGLKVALLVGAIVAIVLLVSFAAPCAPTAPHAFEQFTTEFAQRIDTIRQIKTDILYAASELEDVVDQTCGLLRDVEGAYLANAGVTGTSLDLPADVQAQMAEASKKRAKTRFETEKRLYATANGTAPLIECFASPSEEDVLADEVGDLERVFASEEIRKILARAESTQATLGFTQSYLSAVTLAGAIGTEGFEGFASPLRGQALLARADQLIAMAQSFIGSIEPMRKQIKQQQQLLLANKDRTARLSSGNPSPADTAAGQALLAESRA
jgi:hypothetical protein